MLVQKADNEAMRRRVDARFPESATVDEAPLLALLIRKLNGPKACSGPLKTGKPLAYLCAFS